MKEKVKEILARELERLDALSRAEGFDLSGFKALDLWIKCHSSFVGQPTKTDEPDTASPESSPTEALLEGLTNSDQSEEEKSN